MYSRDIFPRYSSGGLPIPENYSGNAIHRASSSQASDTAGNRSTGNFHGMNSSASATSGRSAWAGSGTSRVHTPASGRSLSGAGKGQVSGEEHTRVAEVPLTVSPIFSASRQEERRSEKGDLSPRESGREGEIPSVETPSEVVGEGTSGLPDEADPQDSRMGEGASHEREEKDMSTKDPGSPMGDEGKTSEETVTASARPHGGGGGFSSLLSAFLPPKPEGFGALSQIGLEEALLLGVFLLLSQSDSEDDTLMLLALLFLYR